jgi:hypothetical protein
MMLTYFFLATFLAGFFAAVFFSLGAGFFAGIGVLLPFQVLAEQFEQRFENLPIVFCSRFKLRDL